MDDNLWINGMDDNMWINGVDDYMWINGVDENWILISWLQKPADLNLHCLQKRA